MQHVYSQKSSEDGKGVCEKKGQLLLSMAGSFPTNVEKEAYFEIKKNPEFSQTQPAR